MDIIVKVSQLFASLSLLIVLHELGHFLPARLFKTRVEKFYLFFDPWFSVLKKKVGETEYGLGWIPLGGYVKISGMIDESFDKEQMAAEPQPWEFRSKPAWQRLIIMLGGVTVNFLLGFFIFAMMLFTWGEQYTLASDAQYGITVFEGGARLGLQDGDRILSVGGKSFERFEPSFVAKELLINGARTMEIERNGSRTSIDVPEDAVKSLAGQGSRKEPLFALRFPFQVRQLAPGSPAEKAGILAEDKILSLNGTPTPYFSDFLREIRKMPDTDVEIGLLRDGQELTLRMRTTAQGTIGVAPYGEDRFFPVKTKEYGLFEALPAGVARGWGFLSSQLKAFGQIFSGKIDASDSLGGFISIGNMFPSTWDWAEFWNMTAVLSLILAFMNLLPIPALDGGHVLFLLWEVVTGRKVSDKVMEYATMAGFILVLGLILYSNGLDIMRLFAK